MCVCWLGLVTIFVCCTDNNIGAEGARDIAQALEHNSTLQHLNLRGVCISYACATNTPVPYDFMHIYTHTSSRKQAY